MVELTRDYIRQNVADTDLIFSRGIQLYEYGAFLCKEANPERGRFIYEVDGNYGDYTARVDLKDADLETRCNCPYPGRGCKHTVAVLLDVNDRINGWVHPEVSLEVGPETPEEPYLTPEEIKAQALEDRRKRASTEPLSVSLGDMYKGEHLVETPQGKQYTVTLHDPVAGKGHCTCPDFLTNRLNVCKHLIRVGNEVRSRRDFQGQMERERFPFVDVYWDSASEGPRLFYERPEDEIVDLVPALTEYFDENGAFKKPELAEMMPLLSKVDGDKRVRIQPSVIDRIDEELMDRQMAEMAKAEMPPLDRVKTELYPYQKEGVRFGLYKKGVLIGDEMGLGKTLQAIVLAILKREIFGFERVLVVTMASLKEQWKREIERFTDEKAAVVAGNPAQREDTYQNDARMFKITNYEAVLRDGAILSRFKPDLVILDEAQRIKNFNTKTADAVKRLPRKHAMVLTGTPLENKLEDVYSIIQFLDPHMLSPLWRFAADHFMISRDKKGKILGYRNLDALHERLKSIVIRRRKEEVLSELPDEVVNNYYLDMTDAQSKIHGGYAHSLLPLLNKKFLTPMDLRRIQELLLCMRRVCDSTYLVDRKTNLSPKLKELTSILDELVFQNNRKVVIFSEWTAMTFLIAKQLSAEGISFVELSGKIPVHKRQALIDEFTNNPRCRVFLSTDAGGTGLNLQAGDCVVNFELPWNPAKMNQRIGRVNRIGQKSRCVNVVNLIMKNSIEERILAGIQLKTDLFQGVFDGTTDMVEFSQEKRAEMLNRLRAMMGEEELVEVRPESRPGAEIPEDTPHYLNPEVLSGEDGRVAYEAEEDEGGAASDVERAASGGNGGGRSPGGDGDFLANQPPERIEAVLNSGMQFINGLFEMATGRKVETKADDDRMIAIDRNTGEVTMKFKLPGFGADQREAS